MSFTPLKHKISSLPHNFMLWLRQPLRYNMPRAGYIFVLATLLFFLWITLPLFLNEWHGLAKDVAAKGLTPMVHANGSPQTPPETVQAPTAHETHVYAQRVSGVARGSIRAMGQQMVSQHFGAKHWPAFDRLIQKESGWNPNAKNRHSTAYGIAQFLSGTWRGTGVAKTANPELQLKAAIIYIENRYGNPTNALSFHLRHNYY